MRLTFHANAMTCLIPVLSFSLAGRHSPTSVAVRAWSCHPGSCSPLIFHFPISFTINLCLLFAVRCCWDVCWCAVLLGVGVLSTHPCATNIDSPIFKLMHPLLWTRLNFDLILTLSCNHKL